jgi:carboxylate-amine ligase
MTFLTDARPRPLVVDPVPRILRGAEWEALEAGLAQRARALNTFVADAHGERRMAAAGRIPERVIETAGCGEPDMCGLEHPVAVHGGVIGFDVVRDGDGVLRVLEDNLRTPSGPAYAAVAREILDQALPFEPPVRRTGPSPAALLREALRAAAPHHDGEPCIVALSDGPGNSAWWEHRRFATALGIPLVTPAQLELRGGRVHVRPAGSRLPQPVDVVYRRTYESQLRHRGGGLTWLGDAFLEPIRRGNVAFVNSFGSGVADDKLVHAYVEEMVRFYLGEEPLLGCVPTYDPCEPSVRSDILARIDELIEQGRIATSGGAYPVLKLPPPQRMAA